MDDLVVVGVTTEQNTANLVPVVQLKAKTYLAIDSDRAAREGWNRGAESVLRSRGLRCDTIVLKPGQERSVVAVRATVAAELRRLELDRTPVVWLLGGGLKPQQLGLFMLFAERRREGIRDLAVYSEPGSRQTVCIEPLPDGRWMETPLPTQADLRIEEIINCFNLQVRRSSPLPARPVVAEYARFRRDRTWRAAWYDRIRMGPRTVASARSLTMAEVNDALNDRSVASRIRAACLERLREVKQKTGDVPDRTIVDVVCKKAMFLGTWTEAMGLTRPLEPLDTGVGTCSKFANYFEQLLIHRVAELLGDARPAVTDCLANVEVVTRDGIQRAEHDVLIATCDGTLTSIDAKTFDVEAKDADARLHNLFGAGGRFARFVPVFPWFEEDFRSGIAPVELEELPLKLDKYRIPFAVVGPTDESFFVRREDDNEGVRVSLSGGPGTVRCTTIEEFVAKLKAG